MSRNQRLLLAAIRAARTSNPRCCFSVGAVLAIGHRVIASAGCTTKTHPKNPKPFDKTAKNQLCAEILCLIRASRVITQEEFRRCSIFITRRRKDGSLAMARPCEFCMPVLKNYGIKNIYYTDNSGRLNHMELTDG